MEAVKDLLARRNVDVAVIPGGLTPVLQPLDKCINKPFKNKVRSQYQAWMVNGPYVAMNSTSFIYWKNPWMILVHGSVPLLIDSAAINVYIKLGLLN